MAKRTKESYSNAGKLGALKTQELWKKRKKEEKIEYEKNPEYCEYCGKVKPYEQYKKHSRFCCRSCSASWTNKHRDKSISEKAAQSLRKYYKENLVLRIKENNIKKVKVLKPTKQNIKKFKKKQICKVCGAIKGECKYPEICKKYQVFKSLQKFGFDLLSIGSEKVYEEYFKVKEILTNIYFNREISGKELKENWNYNSGTANFHKILHSLDIITYTIKEARNKDFELGRTNIPIISNQYKCGWHTTWNNKEVYLRSSYEFDYAKQLDEQNIDYDCECFRIKYLNTKDNEYHCAVPDFYLKDTNTIVEIKSIYTLDIQNMKDKFKAYKEQGYNCKLILEHKEVDLYSL